jgi:hypothetical protein
MPKLLVVPRLRATVPATAATGVPLPLTATLSGANAPTGTITFYLFGPQANSPRYCDETPVSLGTVPVTGNGTYSPDTPFTPTTAGTYWWVWSYSGDANNPEIARCGLWTKVSSTVVTPPTETPPDTSTPGGGSTPDGETAPPPTGGLTPTPVGPPLGDRTAPQFTSKPTAKAGKRTRGRRAVTLRLALSEDATVKVTLTRAAPGIRSGAKCVKRPRRVPAKARRCTRRVAAGRASAQLKAGTGRTLSTARLATGSYRASIVATDAAGNTSNAVTVAFRVS